MASQHTCPDVPAWDDLDCQRCLDRHYAIKRRVIQQREGHEIMERRRQARALQQQRYESQLEERKVERLGHARATAQGRNIHQRFSPRRSRSGDRSALALSRPASGSPSPADKKFWVEEPWTQSPSRLTDGDSSPPSKDTLKPSTQGTAGAIRPRTFAVPVNYRDWRVKNEIWNDRAARPHPGALETPDTKQHASTSTLFSGPRTISPAPNGSGSDVSSESSSDAVYTPSDSDEKSVEANSEDATVDKGKDRAHDTPLNPHEAYKASARVLAEKMKKFAAEAKEFQLPGRQSSGSRYYTLEESGLLAGEPFISIRATGAPTPVTSPTPPKVQHIKSSPPPIDQAVSQTDDKLKEIGQTILLALRNFDNVGATDLNVTETTQESTQGLDEAAGIPPGSTKDQDPSDQETVNIVCMHCERDHTIPALFNLYDYFHCDGCGALLVGEKDTFYVKHRPEAEGNQDHTSALQALRLKVKRLEDSDATSANWSYEQEEKTDDHERQLGKLNDRLSTLETRFPTDVSWNGSQPIENTLEAMQEDIKSLKLDSVDKALQEEAEALRVENATMQKKVKSLEEDRAYMQRKLDKLAQNMKPAKEGNPPCGHVGPGRCWQCPPRIPTRFPDAWTPETWAAVEKARRQGW